MYDLYQISYDYTVKVKNRFKGLNLVDRVTEKQCLVIHSIVQGAVIKTIPKKKKCSSHHSQLKSPESSTWMQSQK